MSENAESRLYTRFAIELPVEARVAACEAMPSLRRLSISCRTRDASVCGLQLHTDRPLPPGTVLKLRVTIPRKEKPLVVQLVGDVIWCNEFPDAGANLGVYLRERPRRYMRRWMDAIATEIQRRCAAT